MSIEQVKQFLINKGIDLHALKHPQDMGKTISERNLYELMNDYASELQKKINWYIAEGYEREIIHHKDILFFAEWIDINGVRQNKCKWKFKGDSYDKTYTTHEMYKFFDKKPELPEQGE